MEETIFERLGIEYEERNGLLYPILEQQKAVTGNDVYMLEVSKIGKYGRLWIRYMKENKPQRCKSMWRFGRLFSKAKEVNDEAYEQLEGIEKSYLSKHMPKGEKGFNTQLKIRNQARMIAEEYVVREIVCKSH